MRRTKILVLIGAIVPFLAGFSSCWAGEEKKDAEGIYTIKSGDTLWDISGRFLNNPFLWPKLWQRNPYITNPHWIYPGNPLRLSPLEEPKKMEEQPKVIPEVATPPPVISPEPQPEVKVSEIKPLVIPEEKILRIPEDRDAGFISDVELKGIGTIVESKEGKNLMSEGDIVYVAFNTAEKIRVGDKFTVFRPSKIVRHPETGERLGRRYNVIGNIRIIDILGNFYAAKVIDSFDAIERGDRLQPYIKEKMEATAASK